MNILRPSGAKLGRLLWSTAAAGRTAGVPHYVVAVFAVQGLAYLTQFIVARIVGPSDFGVVRTVEAILNVLLVVASLGMPMLAVTVIAALQDEKAQGRTLGTLLAISAIGGGAVATGAAVAAGGLADPAPGYLRALAWVMVLSACSRTALNYFQGRQQVQRVAGYLVLLSFVSLGFIVAAVLRWGLPGWVGGRYLSEMLFLALLLRAVGPKLSLSRALPNGERVSTLLVSGAGIAASLLVRTAADNVGIFMLTIAGASPVTIGHFGLASLVLVGLLIVPTSIGSVALPRIVARLPDPASARRLVLRAGVSLLAVSLLFAVVAGLLARPAIGVLYPSYRGAAPLVWLLVVAVPFRSLSALCGMVLVACRLVRLTVMANLVSLLVTVVAGAAAVGRWGAVGIACAVVAGEVISAAVYGAAVWRGLPRAHAQS